MAGSYFFSSQPTAAPASAWSRKAILPVSTF
jgi:hypothetical protein